jgi:hypothetical protein
MQGWQAAESGALVDFDVMTELVFPDRETFLAWMGKLAAPENGDRVAVDECRLLGPLPDGSLRRRRARHWIH